MAQVYFNVKPNGKAVFDYYYRSNPFDGGYAIFAGLEDVLAILETLKFSASDLKYLEDQGFESGFIEYLKDFRFRGNIYSSREGDIVFPNRPVLQVEANIIEAQIIETLLLNFLNFQSLIATKASRIRYSAPGKTLLDMGLRRAHATGGYYASRAAVIGGFDGTSNRSEEHTSELQSRPHLVCRLLLEKKKKIITSNKYSTRVIRAVGRLTVLLTVAMCMAGTTSGFLQIARRGI